MQSDGDHYTDGMDILKPTSAWDRPHRRRSSPQGPSGDASSVMTVQVLLSADPAVLIEAAETWLLVMASVAWVGIFCSGMGNRRFPTDFFGLDGMD